MAAKRPSQPPTFDAQAFVNDLLAGKPISPALATQYVNWKRWVESTQQFDGVDKGGPRDVLDALVQFTNAIKGDLDGLTAKEKTDVGALATRVAALEAQHTDPFPGSG